ncbi:GntR family transcriptional regulator [Microbacterium thalli]|uniref:GntR family transcriptional regulator n=1 Tax=Microbacterium thalli TaxID=3027921 RepID=A0ABT5SDP5_9MICO|nr:GntR family transcriptional regulator [Microbacterium thalli]MDD7928325.1 GntR family transcriptional regulator [Microbacterium thalli]MDD7960908.1 GntR family transcriptional regulator [Microbacterium thalli]MDN8548862.1 GntR family transcriptional regulator [Microbacterium thalli]
MLEGEQPVVLPAEQLLHPSTQASPLWIRLSRGLEGAIASGALVPGARLENEVSMSERLSLSRPTVRRAIQELVDKGLLVRRRGVGTQVVHGSVARQIDLTSLHDDLERSGRVPSTRVLDVTFARVGSEIATQLGVDPASRVLKIRRVRYADAVPIAVLENYLPEAFADITAERLAEVGLYSELRERGVTLRVARQRIGARRASVDEGLLLDIGRGAPVLTMDRTAYDADGAAVEYGHHCYRPDLYGFEMTLVDR